MLTLPRRVLLRRMRLMSMSMPMSTKLTPPNSTRIRLQVRAMMDSLLVKETTIQR